MKENRLYKHIYCRDLAIATNKIYTGIHPDYFKVEVSYWNVVDPKFFYPMGLSETVKIFKSELNKWILIK